ncbi:uncharacterized protein LOC143150665 [Ptiloglossa arizonensis]|uniref:uncharacterized protein LOC143150665 n=1 Tax=Ptiloglossa arizonensis TaxID=3350558 RepID=UPI003F9F4F0C
MSCSIAVAVKFTCPGGLHPQGVQYPVCQDNVDSASLLPYLYGPRAGRSNHTQKASVSYANSGLSQTLTATAAAWTQSSLELMGFNFASHQDLSTLTGLATVVVISRLRAREQIHQGKPRQDGQRLIGHSPVTASDPQSQQISIMLCREATRASKWGPDTGLSNGLCPCRHVEPDCSNPAIWRGDTSNPTARTLQFGEEVSHRYFLNGGPIQDYRMDYARVDTSNPTARTLQFGEEN